MPGGIALASQAPIVIDADSFEYSADGMTVVATGNVKVTSDGMEIAGDQLHADLKSEVLVASGRVTFRRGGSSGRCDILTYDLKAGRIEIDSAAISADGMRIQGKSVVAEKDEICLDNGAATRCTLADPCYSVKARRLVIYPGARLEARWVVLWLGRVPIGPVPKLVLPLKPASDGVLPQVAWDESMPHIRLAYDREKGFLVGATYRYPLDDNNRILVDASYATRAGWASELGYDFGPWRDKSGPGATWQANAHVFMAEKEPLQVKAGLTQAANSGRRLGVDVDWKRGLPTASSVWAQSEAGGYRLNVAIKRERGDSGYVDSIPSVRVESKQFSILGDRITATISGDVGRYRESSTGVSAGRVGAVFQASPAKPIRVTPHLRLGGSLKLGGRLYGEDGSRDGPGALGFVDGTATLTLNLASPLEVQVGYHLIRKQGKGPFSFDDLSDTDELQGRVRLAPSREWTVEWTGRYSLRSSSLEESDWALTRHFHCYDVMASWDEKKDEFNLGIRFVR